MVAQMSAAQPQGNQEIIRNKTAMLAEYISEAPNGHTVPSRTF